MKVINLDKLAIRHKVIFGGKEYEVRGMTVGEYMEAQAKPLEDESNLETAIGYLTRLSDIPRDVLLTMDPTVLWTLFGISQGNLPEDAEEEKAKN